MAATRAHAGLEGPLRNGYPPARLTPTCSMDEFELESEPDATCPLCVGHPEYDDHDVQVKPNKAGDPFFHCERLRVSVNVRENGTEFLAPFVENAGGEALAQPEGSSEGDSPTLADVLGNESDGENA